MMDLTTERPDGLTSGAWVPESHWQPRSTIGSLPGSMYEDDLRGDSSSQATSLSNVNSTLNLKPNSRAIPEAYVKVIDMIETKGWDAMTWANEFTLLHWAAKNDMTDLCAKFMFLKADPNKKDNTGRTPVDYATEANSLAALEQLAKPAPLVEPKLALMIGENRSLNRNSIIVDGRLRQDDN